MDPEIKTHLIYIKEGIDEIKQGQENQWEVINENKSSISNIKGWIKGILYTGTLTGIIVSVIKVVTSKLK